MQIEAGKYYKTRDGRKVGPMKDRGGNDWPFTEPETTEPCWSRKGYIWNSNDEQPNDLISEWVEGPVRTVTRREIVPGVYGRFEVMSGQDIPFLEIPGHYINLVKGNAPELRAAAAVLIELAEALEE